MAEDHSLFGGEPQNPLPETTLEELPERLRDAAARAGWTSLMPVQAKGIPYVLAGRDMLIQARTGSGKTGAFILPMLDLLDPEKKVLQALILVPTRELAKQVERDAQTLCGDGGFKTVAVYGGVGYGAQLDGIRAGAHIMVGTPGRVLDHLLQRNFNLDALKMLVYDEADRMMSMGFYPDMRRVQRYLPGSRMHSCMFSATFPPSVLGTAREFLVNPDALSLSRDHIHVTDTEHVFYLVPGLDKDRVLMRLIELENPSSALIFCNTRSRVHYVSAVLQNFGYDADELSSDLSQSDRERVLDRVRKGTLRFLSATDVAARGLDIPQLSHVFLYEPPEDVEDYIHRAGRTGRAGATGTAISLVSDVERLALTRIARNYGIELVEKRVPTDEEVATLAAERLMARLEARLRDRSALEAERRRRFLPLAHSLVQNEEELSLIAMLLDDEYQQWFHAPPPAPGSEGEPREREREPNRERRPPRPRGDRRGGRRGPRRR